MTTELSKDEQLAELAKRIPWSLRQLSFCYDILGSVELVESACSIASCFAMDVTGVSGMIVETFKKE